MKKKKIVITGSSGFLGEHLMHALAEHDYELNIFDRDRHDLLRPKSLESLVANSDIVIHLAGLNRDADMDLLKINTLGTNGLLEALTYYAPTAKLIFSSTFQIYYPQNLYAYSKKFAEELIAYYSKKYNFRAVILRFSNLYGPGGKPFYNSVIATFAHLIKRDEKVHIKGDGEQKKDYLFVADAVDAIIKTINYDPRNVETFDICTGRLVSIIDVIRMIEKVLGKKVKVIHAKDKTVNPILKRNFHHAYEVLGWEPNISLEEGLKVILQ